MTSQPCDYPNCPSARGEKLLDERHEEIKNTLSFIKEGQEKVITIGENVAKLLVEVQNLKEAKVDNSTEHNELFKRLRRVETKYIWITGGAAGIFGFFEFIKLIGIIK